MLNLKIDRAGNLRAARPTDNEVVSGQAPYPRYPRDVVGHPAGHSPCRGAKRFDPPRWRKPPAVRRPWPEPGWPRMRRAGVRTTTASSMGVSVPAATCCVPMIMARAVVMPMPSRSSTGASAGSLRGAIPIGEDPGFGGGSGSFHGSEAARDP